MQSARIPLVAASLGLALGVGVACDGPEPTEATAVDHEDHFMAFPASPDVNRKIADLRRWSASFHTLEGAAAAGYTVNIGCIDETVNGVDPNLARGMGYHVTRGDVDLVNDGAVDIDTPEFLVFAPHPLDAQIPKEERLGRARLIGFDYYVPAVDWPHSDPPEFFGVPFNWSEAFQGWIRHIWLWGNNPQGMYEDFNQAVPLCRELLSP